LQRSPDGDAVEPELSAVKITLRPVAPSSATEARRAPASIKQVRAFRAQPASLVRAVNATVWPSTSYLRIVNAPPRRRPARTRSLPMGSVDKGIVMS
jgi:hypothetical protein